MKLKHFKKKLDFENDINIENTDIVFIQDSQQVWTHNQTYGNDNRTFFTTTLSSLPQRKLIVATISDNQSLSFSSIINQSEETHIIVKNNISSDLVVTLPNSGDYVCFVDTALTVPANGYSEINVISDGTKMYIRAI